MIQCSIIFSFSGFQRWPIKFFKPCRPLVTGTYQCSIRIFGVTESRVPSSGKLQTSIHITGEKGWISHQNESASEKNSKIFERDNLKLYPKFPSILSATEIVHPSNQFNLIKINLIFCCFCSSVVTMEKLENLKFFCSDRCRS